MTKIKKAVRKTLGFALIELLVVISIIAILAAMLLSALPQARAATTDIVCINNMRQIASAMRMYADDYGGVVPFVSMKPHKTAYKMLYDTGYITNRDVLYCPNLPPRNWQQAQEISGDPYNSGIGMVYPAELLPGYYSWSADINYLYLNLGKIKYPDFLVMLADSIGKGQVNGAWSDTAPPQQLGVFYWYKTTNAREPADNGIIHLRHSGKANVAFADGHVESLDVAGFQKVLTIEPPCSPGSAGSPKWATGWVSNEDRTVVQVFP